VFNRAANLMIFELAKQADCGHESCGRILRERMPLCRVGTPDKVGATVAFLQPGRRMRGANGDSRRI
jgi:hypothetical protein